MTSQAPGTEHFFSAVGRRLVRHALTADGHLSDVAVRLMPCNVQYACVDETRGLLYVACSNGGVASLGDAHCLVVVEVSGPLRQRGLPCVLPGRPIHIALDEPRRRLLVAYNRPAAVTVHALDADGDLAASADLSQAQDVVGWFPHQILPVPGRDDLLLTCRGDDARDSRPENPGSLRVLGMLGGALSARQVVAPSGGFGFGPRNCAFHPCEPWLYVVLERQNELGLFQLREDVIEPEPVCRVDVLRRRPTVYGAQLAGAIELHPSGRYAYVVNRSHAIERADEREVWADGENSIAVFRLDAATGRPVMLETVPLNGLHARCVSLAHGGTLLLAAIRQPSARRTADGIVDCPAGLSVFRIGIDGCLTPLGHHDTPTQGDEQLFWAGCPIPAGQAVSQ